jgi:hypothetical protein
VANLTVVVPNTGDVITVLMEAVDEYLDGPNGIDRTGMTPTERGQAYIQLHLRALYLTRKQQQNVAAQQAAIDAANAAAVTASQTIV